MRASSISQKRGTGNPGKVTGAGMVASTSDVTLWSAVVVSDACVLTSKLLQSIGPSISLAEKVMSSCALGDKRVPTDSAYSSRGGFHASSAGPAGSLYIEAYQVSQAVATC